MTCIIVDDEPKARKVLSRLIEINCPELSIVGTYESLPEARAGMLAQQPNLVFLDINLPGASGFDLIEGLSDRTFAVVFTTAHEQHAVKAFEHQAQDYLMKPVHSERLKAAVKRAKDFLDLQRKSSRPHGHESQNANASTTKVNKIALPISTGFELFAPDDIIRFKGNGSYSEVYLTNGKKLLLSQNLKRIEALVEGYNFFRIHRSHLVNLKYAKRFTYKDGGFVEMEDESFIEVSRRKLTEFKQQMGFH